MSTASWNAFTGFTSHTHTEGNQLQVIKHNLNQRMLVNKILNRSRKRFAINNNRKELTTNAHIHCSRTRTRKIGSPRSYYNNRFAWSSFVYCHRLWFGNKCICEIRWDRAKQNGEIKERQMISIQWKIDRIVVGWCIMQNIRTWLDYGWCSWLEFSQTERHFQFCILTELSLEQSAAGATINWENRCRLQEWY